MQLRQFYYIATKLSSRKGATTFGDLPDCLVAGPRVASYFPLTENNSEGIWSRKTFPFPASL